MTHNKKSIVKTSNSVSTDNTSQAVYAVRIVGATMNRDLKSLLKILADTEGINDALAYCTLTGIFSVVTTADKEKGGEDEDFTDYEFQRKVREGFSSWINSFEKILIKNEYQDYPIAVLPEANISKERFWNEVWKKLFSIAFVAAYTQTGRKDTMYELTDLVNKILMIALNYELCNKENFFMESVKKVACAQLDAEYQSSFSNSVNKIWDAGRAFWEYFLRKMVLFNPAIPTNVQKVVEKRWRAWFLLEDQYKQTQKTVKRPGLLKEMEGILKLL
jgi:hypothetical protein